MLAPAWSSGCLRDLRRVGERLAVSWPAGSDPLRPLARSPSSRARRLPGGYPPRVVLGAWLVCVGYADLAALEGSRSIAALTSAPSSSAAAETYR